MTGNSGSQTVTRRTRLSRRTVLPRAFQAGLTQPTLAFVSPIARKSVASFFEHDPHPRVETAVAAWFLLARLGISVC